MPAARVTHDGTTYFRIHGDTYPDAPYSVRVAVQRPLTPEQAEQLAALVGYAYAKTGGERGNGYVQDSPNSIVYFCDTTKGRAYRRLDQFFDDVRAYVPEGSPQRKTKDNTRLVEGLGDLGEITFYADNVYDEPEPDPNRVHRIQEDADGTWSVVNEQAYRFGIIPLQEHDAEVEVTGLNRDEARLYAQRLQRDNGDPNITIDEYDHHGYNQHGVNRWGRRPFCVELGCNANATPCDCGKAHCAAHPHGGLPEGSVEVNGIIFGPDGFNADGYDQEGYDATGYSVTGFDRNGYDADGFDYRGRNPEGFDRDGYDQFGLDRDGRDKAAAANDRYDDRGFDADGVHRNGTLLDDDRRDVTGEQYNTRATDIDMNEDRVARTADNDVVKFKFRGGQAVAVQKLTTGADGKPKWAPPRTTSVGEGEKLMRLVTSLNPAARAVPESVAAKFGQATGTCLVCSRPLSDPTSQARGYGPECASKLYGN